MAKNKKLIYIIIIAIVILAIFFTPIPFRYGPGIACKPCDNRHFKCPKCPQEGDIGWSPSLFRSLLIRIKQKGGGAFESSHLEPQSYIVCGCGCCPGVKPEEKCLYHLKGDDIQKIIENDKKVSQSPECAMVGCSFPIKYIYCD